MYSSVQNMIAESESETLVGELVWVKISSENSGNLCLLGVHECILYPLVSILLCLTAVGMRK